MPNSLFKLHQPRVSLTRLLATLTVATLSCVWGCVDLTEPWKQHMTPADTGAGGAGIEVGDGGAGRAIDAATGDSIGPFDGGLAGTGGGLDLGGGAGGAGGSMDLGQGGAGGAVDAPEDVPILGTGGVATGGVSGGSGGAATGGTITGAGGAATGGTGGGTIGGSGGKATGGTTGGTGGKSTGGASGGVDAAPPPPDGGTVSGLVVHYTCESLSGNVLPDTSGSANNGTLIDAPPATLDGGTAVRGYSIGTGKVGSGSLVLTSGSSGYVSMPPSILTGATEMTIATWVYLTGVEQYRRIFDIGIISADPSSNPMSGTTNVYMNLVPATGTTTSARKLTFSITNAGYVGEQRLVDSSTFPTNRWIHVAVVLGGGSGTLYINGAAGTPSAITLRPADLGAINYAYIGKSQFTSDAYFDGQIDEFRIYNRALSAGDIKGVYNGQ